MSAALITKIVMAELMPGIPTASTLKDARQFRQVRRRGDSVRPK
jgi:hypothetical protein